MLDVVIYSYRNGSTPETITDQYPTLALDDVYLALGYYLRHRTEIDEYLHKEEAEAEQFRQQYEAEHPPN